MVVDNERVVALLKKHFADAHKPNFGQRECLALIAATESECMVEESVIEKALRLYGVVLSDDLLRPLLDRLETSGPVRHRVDVADGDKVHASRADPDLGSEESHGSRSREGTAAVAV